MSTLKDVISLKFKSIQGDGVLFHGEGQRGDHITLELQKGRLALHLNLGKVRLCPTQGGLLRTPFPSGSQFLILLIGSPWSTIQVIYFSDPD